MENRKVPWEQKSNEFSINQNCKKKWIPWVNSEELLQTLKEDGEKGSCALLTQ